MNSKERIALCLAHKEPDRVPVYPILCGISRKLTGIDYPTFSTDSAACAESFAAATRKFGTDCIVTLIDLSVECSAWGQPLIFPPDQAAHPDYSKCIISEIEDYANIKKVDYRLSERMMMHIDVIRRLSEEFCGEVPVYPFVFGPLGTLSMMRSQQEMYYDLYDDPDAVKCAAREVNETLKDYCGALIDAGADAIMLDTLFASGSIMSREMWLDFEGDLVRELSDFIRARGSAVMIHNCGKDIYFDEQIETMSPAAISFLYPPYGCKDFVECKKKYGDSLTLIGCVQPSDVLSLSDEDWVRECEKQIDEMAAGGGFVLATGCEYPANADFTKAVLMIDTAKNYGKYNN